MPPSTPGSPPQSTSRNSHWRARCIERCTAGWGRGPLEKDLPSRHLASGLPELLHSASARPGGQFTVRAEIWAGHYAWLEVEDQGGPWTARDNSAPGGRGLAIVTALAGYWDIRGDDTARVVCARIDWPG
jgi:hypothetical protein